MYLEPTLWEEGASILFIIDKHLHNHIVNIRYYNNFSTSIDCGFLDYYEKHSEYFNSYYFKISLCYRK